MKPKIWCVNEEIYDISGCACRKSGTSRPKAPLPLIFFFFFTYVSNGFLKVADSRPDMGRMERSSLLLLFTVISVKGIRRVC